MLQTHRRFNPRLRTDPSPDEVLIRTTDFVATIRKKHPKIPIISIQSIARERENSGPLSRRI